MTSGPRSVGCYICGRQYMFGSIDIHVKQCEDLFRKREAKKPKKQRKKLPKRPAHFTGKDMSRLGDEALQKLANQVQESYENLSLVKCKWCQRTMNEKALTRHNVLCTSVKPMRSVTDPVRRGNVAGLTSPPKSTGGAVPTQPKNIRSKKPPRPKKRPVCLPPPHSESEELRLKQASRAAVLKKQGSSNSNTSRKGRKSKTKDIGKQTNNLTKGVKQTSSFKDKGDNGTSLFKENSRVWSSPPTERRSVMPKKSLWGGSTEEDSPETQTLIIDDRPRTSIKNKHKLSVLRRPRTSITEKYKMEGDHTSLKKELLAKADKVEKKMVAAMEELSGLRMLINRLE